MRTALLLLVVLGCAFAVAPAAEAHVYVLGVSADGNYYCSDAEYIKVPGPVHEHGAAQCWVLA